MEEPIDEECQAADEQEMEELVSEWNAMDETDVSPEYSGIRPGDNGHDQHDVDRSQRDAERGSFHGSDELEDRNHLFRQFFDVELEQLIERGGILHLQIS